ncbi:MAG TPA: hypothetical protein DD384_03735, partial [Firmicutes bacterium]|nr:hypothetical protein [Bacillota bacterium]
IDSIGMPSNAEYDGPAQIKSLSADSPRGVGYPNETVIAQTFSKTIAYAFGLSYGSECVKLNVAGAWAPGVNIHRTPLGGRNFEYYSEDTILSSYMVTETVRGMQNAGVYPYIKHFVINDTETHRYRLFNWCTEQALRETYLKPFQWAIQKADALGLMTTYGRIGAVYTGGSVALNTVVARGEWQFKGSIITDYSGPENSFFMVLDQALRAGVDKGMAVGFNSKYGFDYSENSTKRLQYAMREAMHHSVYTWLRALHINGNYNAEADGESKIVMGQKIEPLNWWKPTLFGLDVFVGFAIAVWAWCVYYDQAALILSKMIKRKKDDSKNDDSKKEGE